MVRRHLGEGVCINNKIGSTPFNKNVCVQFHLLFVQFKRKEKRKIVNVRSVMIVFFLYKYY